MLASGAVDRVRREWLRVVQSTPPADLNDAGGIDIMLDLHCVKAVKT